MDMGYDEALKPINQQVSQTNLENGHFSCGEKRINISLL